MKKNVNDNQSTPFNHSHSKAFDDREKQTVAANEMEERLNVSWVWKFCNPAGENVRTKLVFTRLLPCLNLPPFSGNPLEWPAFISLFTCLAHDQPMTNTQRMTHLQQALIGDAKNMVGGMLNHGHLY